MHQESTFSPLLFTIMVDVITESVRNGLMSKMLYVDDMEEVLEMGGSIREQGAGRLKWL